MSVDTPTEETNVVPNVSDDKTNVTNTVSAEDFQTLTDQLASNNAILEKLRSNEKHNQQVAKDSGAKNLEDALKTIQTGATTEALEWKNKFELLETEHTTLKDTLVRQEKVDIITTELDKFDVRDIGTTMKLLDISDLTISDGKVDATILETKMKALQVSDPILFNEKGATPPDIKPAGNDDSNVTNYETEMNGATSQKQIMSIMKKYNKIK